MYRKLKSLTTHDSVWWKSVFVLGLRGTSVLALFCVDVGLGRTLGTSEFGVYSNALAVIMILMVFSLFGLENMLIREISIALKQGLAGDIRKMVRWGIATSLGLAITISALFSIFILFVHPYENHMMQKTVLVGLLLLPMLVCSVVISSILRGLHKILTGQAVQHLVQPLVLVIGIGFFYFYGPRLTPEIAMTVSAAGWFAAMVFALVLLKRNICPIEKGAPKQPVVNSLWTTSLVFAVIAGVQMTNSRIDIILLYWLGSESDAGIYSATVRVCDLLVFSIVAINISIGPSIAHLHHSGEKVKLQSLLTKTARIGSLATTPIIVLAAMFSNSLMGIFGHGFSGHPWSLIALCVGQAVVVLTGSKALLLVMSGQERATAFVLSITAILHLMMSFVLIPEYGILGAAISTAASVICWSIWLTIVSIRKLGIDPTVFNLFSKTK